MRYMRYIYIYAFWSIDPSVIRNIRYTKRKRCTPSGIQENSSSSRPSCAVHGVECDRSAVCRPEPFSSPLSRSAGPPVTCPLSPAPTTSSRRIMVGELRWGLALCGVWEGILIQHATHDVGPTMTAPIPALIFHRFYSRPSPPSLPSSQPFAPRIPSPLLPSPRPCPRAPTPQPAIATSTRNLVPATTATRYFIP